ncbi:MAG: hypothetical protein KC621_27880, partial [Myxococcales bacterium]|nr:hypothetical protein [Myxococcales bacterium]
DTDADSDADTDAHTGLGPWSNGDPSRPPPVTGAPPDWFSGCAPNGMLPAPIVDDPDNEVVVDAFSDTWDVHHMDVDTAGWYHLYNDPPANDGPSQWNESIFIRIQNGTYPQSSAVLTNCGDDWVTVDGDNVQPVPVLQYLGTFWFDAGRNTIVVAHFCPVVNAGQCGALENRNDPGSRCAGPDNNRLRMVSNGLCIAEPAP